jgi:glutaredoxin
MKWVSYVDQALGVVDRALDSVRKTKRKRLETVPEPPAPPDPFVEKAKAPANAAAPAPVEKPLGDPSLPAQVYGTRSCEPSGRVVRTLREHGIDALFVNMSDPDNADLESRLIRETKIYATPYVYLRGTFIGGEAQVMERAKAGTL